jgi:WD40 repeat protein
MIATAATNGAVVIWNIESQMQKHGKLYPLPLNHEWKHLISFSPIERVINDHARTVNKISWHPEHAYTLLSGSQDGTMKLWVWKSFAFLW